MEEEKLASVKGDEVEWTYPEGGRGWLVVLVSDSLWLGSAAVTSTGATLALRVKALELSADSGSAECGTRSRGTSSCYAIAYAAFTYRGASSLPLRFWATLLHGVRSPLLSFVSRRTPILRLASVPEILPLTDTTHDPQVSSYKTWPRISTRQYRSRCLISLSASPISCRTSPPTELVDWETSSA